MSGSARPRALRWLIDRPLQLLRDEGAISAVEFALVMPVLLLFLVAATEMSWFVMANYKVTRAAAVLADLTARAQSVTTGDLQDIFAATSHVVAPMDFAGDGRAIISSVDNPTGTGARITWQRASTSTITAPSLIGSEGAAPTLGGTLTVQSGESLIIAEAYLDYRPLLGLIPLQMDRIYGRAVERPRYGSVTLNGS